MKRLLIVVAAVVVGVAQLGAQQSRSTIDKLFASAEHKASIEGDLKGAIEEYKRIVAAAGGNRSAATRALLRMAEAHQQLGDAEAQRIYERLVRDYQDQPDAVSIARARLRSDRVETPAGPMVRRLLSQKDDGSNPDIGPPSPDGRYFAALIRNGDLVLRNIVTGETRELTKAPNATTFADDPIFAPDGRSILFAWFAWPEDEWQLRSVNIDGSNNRLLARDAYPGAMSPDGRHAAVQVQRNGVQQIAMLNVTTGELRSLRSLEWRQPNIGNFSADGRFLVYSVQAAQESPDRQIALIAIDGSTESVLLAAPGIHDDPFFTPDGSHVVFTSNRSGRSDLWAVPIKQGKAAGPLQLLKADIGSVQLLGFDRGGTLYFRQGVDQIDAYSAAIDPSTHKVTSQPVRVSDRFVGKTAAPRWSPDGQSMAYLAVPEQRSRYGTGADVTVVVKEAPGRERSFTVPFNAVANAHNLRWFPDGRSILFVEWGPSRVRTFRRLDLSSGELRLLFEAPVGRPESVAISSDGRTLLYTLPAQKQNSVIRRDLASGQETTLLSAPGNHGLSLSPDGRSIATIKNVSEDGNRWSVWVTDLASGESREVWRPQDRRVYPGQSAWDPSGRGIYVTAQEKSADAEIWFVPADGSAAVSVGISMPVLSAVTVHPDGRHIGFTGGHSSEEAWSVANLFPANGTGKN